VSDRSTTALRRRARTRGVAVAYTDADGRRRAIAPETLDAVLALLEEPTGGAEGAGATGGDVPAVVVAWDGGRGALDPLATALSRVRPWRAAVLHGEDGSDLGPVAPGAASGTTTAPLPYGVHSVHAGGECVAHVVAAPRRADGGTARGDERSWGLFAPAYAIRDARDRAAGDLTSLGRLGALVGRLGGGALATLPMLAEPATADGGAPGQRPYSPISRMFWNEAYLDLDRVPELSGSDGATRRLLDAARPPRTAPEQDASKGADLASLASAARPALDEAVRRMREAGGRRLGEFGAHLARHPGLERYARFRAACEKAGADPRLWPASWRAGRIGPDDVDPDAADRHAFAQWATDAQLGDVAASLRTSGVGLVVDLPVGCSAAGYDPWAHPAEYVAGATIGAPPDGFFGGGQDWGVPPPHPGTDRRAGYRVLRQCLAHNLRHASVLRVDHVLGWSRLWWVPAGAAAAQGTYVSYPLEELLAVACLEAWRHGARLVGEDLGTVERGLRPKLRAHGIAGTRVAIFDLGASSGPLRPPAGTVAYVDTHDTATWAGWFTGTDVARREHLGLLTARSARLEREGRARARRATVERLVAAGRLRGQDRDDVLAVLAAVLAELGASKAETVLVAAEDLWAEPRAQNLPGTTGGHRNFSQRFARTVEELEADGRALALLRALDAARRHEPRRIR